MPNIIFGQLDPKFKPAIDSMRSELERNDIHDTTRLNLEFTLAQTMWNLRLGFRDSLAVKSHNALKQAELSDNKPNTNSKKNKSAKRTKLRKKQD